MERIRVLYIAGAGRSGSTLAARLLGELPGFHNVGEAAGHLLNPAVRRLGLPCGCGAPTERCPFWSGILPTLRLDVAAPHRLRAFPTLLSPLRSRRLRRSIREAQRAVLQLYEGVCSDSESIVVDSSKAPAVALLLAGAPGIELDVLHLFRDPRAFVSSRSEAKAYLRAMTPLRAVASWTGNNVGAALARWRVRRYWLVAYEDLVRRPEDYLRMLGRGITGVEPSLPFLEGNEATLGAQHMLSGNPDKLTAGRTQIRARAWSLPWGARLWVAALTLPLSKTLGLLATRPGRSAAPDRLL